jgi:hypothetical protein
MPRVYVSHRRGRGNALASRICDRLRWEFGQDEVFIDIDSIPPGASFIDHVRKAIGHCEVMIAIVGREWLARLQDPHDFVRLELEMALSRRITVIPVLIDGSPMPYAKELPHSLRDFAYIHAVKVNDDPDFDQAMIRLIEPIRQTPHSFRGAAPRSAATKPVARPMASTGGALSSMRDALSVPRPKTALQRARMLDDNIEFAVSYPPSLQAGTPFLVDAWLFLRNDRDNARDRAKEQKPDTGFRSGGSATLARGAAVTVRIKIQSWKIEPAWQSIVWDGSITNVPFAARAPETLPSVAATGICSFFVGGLRIGQVAFELSTKESGKQIAQARGIETAFASYASKDRRRVLARVQGIEKLPIKVFVDVRNLKTNDEYPVELLRQIEASDVLYLFWSRHASRSEWVEREWKHGLAEKGAHFIDPVPLVDPRKVPPPEELGKTKHFDDWTLAYTAYENSRGRWDRIRAWLVGE